MADDFILSSTRLDELLIPHRDTFPQESDFLGYRNHCLRMLNVCLLVSDDEPDRHEKLEIALAFHDLTIFPDRTLDYLDGATALALEHLAKISRDQWSEEVELMIRNHHKITRYEGPYANLVESFRRADWVDVSFGTLRSGLDKNWVKSLHTALPLYTIYPKTLMGVIGRYVVTHLRKPLPNFKL